MSSRRPRPGPDLIGDDPGAWSIVSFAREAQGAQLIGRGGRRRQTPGALLSTRAPTEIGRPLPGLDPSLGVAGAGPIRLVALHREGARRLWFDDGGRTLRGVAARVVRRWSVPDLAPGPHDYPEHDPAAALPPPAPPNALGEPVEGEIAAPGGALVAAATKSGRLFGVAFLRLPEREVVRFVAGAAAAAWTDDGAMLAIGGDWGVMLGEPAAAPAPAGPS